LYKWGFFDYWFLLSDFNHFIKLSKSIFFIKHAFFKYVYQIKKREKDFFFIFVVCQVFIGFYEFLINLKNNCYIIENQINMRYI